MNADQYRRANANSFNVCVVIFLSGALMTVYNMMQEGLSGGKIAIIITAVLGAAMAACGNFKFSTVKLGSVLIMGGATIFYFVLLIR